MLISLCLIKQGLTDCEYSMHPLVHAWGRDRMLLSRRQECSSMAYGTLSCSLRDDRSQPYGFRRVLVTHVRANMHESIKGKDQKTNNYFDDSCGKFGWLLQEQGYSSEAKELQVQVVNARKRVLGVENPDTIRATEDLARTYADLGNYNEAEKLEKQVLDARNRMFGADHPGDITVRQRSWRNKSWMQETEFLDLNIQIQSRPWEVLHQHMEAWGNTMRQRSWRSEF